MLQPLDYGDASPDGIRALTDAAIGAADDLVAAAIDAPESGYEAILGRIETAGLLIDDAAGRGAFLGHVHPDEAVRAAARLADERIEKWRVRVRGDGGLAAAIRRYATTPEAIELTGDGRAVLDTWLRDIRRAGTDLPADRRAEIERLQGRIVELQVAFVRNVDESDRTIDLAAEDLASLPETLATGLGVADATAPVPVELDFSRVLAILETAPRRSLRERTSRAWLSRAGEANRVVLTELLAARRDLATALGWPSWPAYRTEIRMAGNPAAVTELLETVTGPLRALARAELAAMGPALAADEGEPGPIVVQEWDWRFYDARRRAELGVDPVELAGYFALDDVLTGLFDLVADVFGVRVTEIAETGGWHESVRRYRLSDRRTGTALGEVLFDPHPRAGKEPGAFAYPIRNGRRDPSGSWVPTICALVANLTPPAGDRPALLAHQDVETLFHEFGHVLDGLLTRYDRPPFSWDWVPLDWVEAPSQIMEHWAWHPDVLRRFARDHRTGEPIPVSILDRLADLRRLNLGLRTVPMLSRTMLDVELHAPDPELDMDAVYRAAWAIRETPLVEGSFEPASFMHIAAIYDAGYYGYLWAKVFGDDMFGRFARDGVLSPEVGAAYRREVLEPSWSVDPADRMARFLGRSPSSEAFLEGLGIIGEAPGTDGGS